MCWFFYTGLWAAQVHLRYAVRHEPHAPHVVDGRWSQADVAALKRLAYAELSSLEVDPSFRHHLPRLVAVAIRDRGEFLREGAAARRVPAQGRSHTEGLVRSLQVVHIPPAVQGLLAGHEVGKPPALQRLSLQGAVEPLLFALGSAGGRGDHGSPARPAAATRR